MIGLLFFILISLIILFSWFNQILNCLSSDKGVDCIALARSFFHTVGGGAVKEVACALQVAGHGCECGPAIGGLGAVARVVEHVLGLVELAVLHIYVGGVDGSLTVGGMHFGRFKEHCLILGAARRKGRCYALEVDRTQIGRIGGVHLLEFFDIHIGADFVFNRVITMTQSRIDAVEQEFVFLGIAALNLGVLGVGLEV